MQIGIERKNMAERRNNHSNKADLPWLGFCWKNLWVIES